MLLARGVVYLESGRDISQSDIAVETISRAIIDGNLQPGSRLRQEDLAQRLGISGTPIREALRRRQAEGLAARMAAEHITPDMPSPRNSLWVKPQRAMQSTLEHDRILDALRSHDPDRAAEETQRHIRTVGDYLIASIAGAAKEALGD